MEVELILLGISLILFFGLIAELIYRKLNMPDILFLILLGFVLGPHGLKYISPAQLAPFAPLFTTFALMFLLFDGAFNIDLRSFAKEFPCSFPVAIINFIVSASIAAGIMYAFEFNIITSILMGVMVGGVSSSFVIPVLKQLKLRKETFSLLTLESALTDVFTIVLALAIMRVISLNTFDFRTVMVDLVSLFSIAGMIGIIAGIVWLVLFVKIFKEHKSYMITIAFLILTYVITEYLGGNGAIAALFFGLVLRNSKLITSIFKGIISKKPSEKKHALEGELGVSVTTPSEHFFYDQISFFLKTFFFVYVGLLLDISNYKVLLIGGIIAISFLVFRNISSLVTRLFGFFGALDRALINSVFGRGLAAVAIVQIAIQNNVPGAVSIAEILYVVITGTIILSSIRIFVLRTRSPAFDVEEAVDKKKDKGKKGKGKKSIKKGKGKGQVKKGLLKKLKYVKKKK